MNNQTLREKYIVEPEIYRDPSWAQNTWSYLTCKIYEVNPETKVKTQIGEYQRNYSAFYDTWEPFEQDGKHYALLSRQYVGTSVMELPSCKIIAEENFNSNGFCPTGFYVPTHVYDYFDEKYKNQEDWNESLIENEFRGKFGFVRGCVWGDDCSDKIEFLDLRDITKGIIRREAKFGYLELPRGTNGKLSDNIIVTNINKETGCFNFEFKTVKFWRGTFDKTLAEDKMEWIDYER